MDQLNFFRLSSKYNQIKTRKSFLGLTLVIEGWTTYVHLTLSIQSEQITGQT
jgi:hypothetical protein